MGDQFHICSSVYVKKIFKVREFCDVSGKNESLQKCQGNVGEFYISA